MFFLVKRYSMNVLNKKCISYSQSFQTGLLLNDFQRICLNVVHFSVNQSFWLCMFGHRFICTLSLFIIIVVSVNTLNNFVIVLSISLFCNNWRYFVACVMGRCSKNRLLYYLTLWYDWLYNVHYLKTKDFE